MEAATCGQGPADHQLALPLVPLGLQNGCLLPQVSALCHLYLVVTDPQTVSAESFFRGIIGWGGEGRKGGVR